MKNIKLIISVILFLFLFLNDLNATSYNTNIIQGGTAESSNDLNRWNKTGTSIGILKRGAYSGGWAGTPPSNGGSYFFYARGGDITVTQSINFSDLSADVDAGTVKYDFSAYLGGYGDGDTINIRLVFKDASNTKLMTYSTGNFTSKKVMTYFSHSKTLPAGTRKVTVSLIFKRHRGTDTDGYTDNISLKLIQSSTPPIMDPIPDQTAKVGQSYSLDLSTYAHETEGDPITQYNLTCLPDGLKFNQSTGLLDGKPKTAGTYNCSATAEDDDGLSNNSEFNLTVEANNPPIADAGPDQNILQDENATMDGSGSSDDGGIISYSWAMNGHTYSGMNPVIPGSDLAPGDNTVTLTVSDAAGLTDTDTTVIHVMEVVENADDLCYEDIITTGTMCIGMGPCAGGVGCKKEYPLRNIGDSNLSNVEVAYKENGMGGSFASDCGVEPSGTCRNSNTFDHWLIEMGFSKASIYDFNNDIAPETSENSIWTKAFISGYCFTGENLYGSYIKEDKLYRGKLRKCDAPKYKCAHPHAFETRFQSIVAGDLVAIGNSNTCIDLNKDGKCDTEQRWDNKHNTYLRNDVYNNIYINKFSSTQVANQPDNLMNVSGAKLKLPDGAKIKKAYLYWHGEVWNFRTGVITNSAGMDSGDDGIALMNKSNTISFKTPITNYASKTADEFYYFFLKRKQNGNNDYGHAESFGYGYGPNWGYSNNHYFKYDGKTRYEMHFQGIIDVTSDLQSVENANGSANGTYWVGNIQSTVGRLWWPGVEAAWTLQVIYTKPDVDSRSISLSDGYVGLYAAAKQGDDYAKSNGCPTGMKNTGVYNHDIKFTISGFLTPKRGDFFSDLTLFVTESDPEPPGGDNSNHIEELSITKKDGSRVRVDGPNAWNYEIKNKDESDNLDRTPNYIYPIGVTIKNYHRKNLLSLDQTSTDIKFETDNDKLMIGVIGFATDLRIPEVCYDYTMFMGNYKLDSIDNEIDTSLGDYNSHLTTRMYIRSKEGNFNLTDANLSYHLPDTSIVEYTQGTLEEADNGQYDYQDASARVISDSKAGFSLKIGEGANSDIYPYEARYIRFDDEIKDSTKDTAFDLQLSAMVDYGIAGVPPIPFTKSFKQEDICGDDNGSYNVEYSTFNIVENIHDYNTYNLFTKVAGQQITYKVYAYDDNDPTKLLTTDLHMPVEIEMIRADDFEKNATITCGDEYAVLPESIIPHKYPYIEKNMGQFTYLPTETMFAYPSLSLRIHYFVDDNNTITTDHNCSAVNISACKPLYAKYNTSLTKCNSDCNGASSDQKCFDCLKTYYDNYSCARDNFTMRPRAFRVELRDSNQTEDTTALSQHIMKNDTLTQINLVAAYKYRFDINATSINSDNPVKLYIQKFGDFKDRNVTMIWNPPGTKTNCVDTNDRNYTFVMYNGSSIHPNLHTAQLLGVDQIGEYKFEIADENLTRYDWFPKYLKHHGNDTAHFKSGKDCIAGSNNDVIISDNTSPDYGKVGCITDNKLKSKGYYPIDSKFYPYSFDTSGLSIGAGPSNSGNIVYINTLDAQTNYPSGYQDTGDKNMSYNIQGTFYAADYSGKKTTNFVTGCYAENVNIMLQHRYLSPVPNSNAELIYDLIDYNTTDHSMIYRNDRNRSIENRKMPQPSTTQNIALTTPQNSSDFAKDMQGAITMDLGYNFERDISKAQNPRLINFKDFNVTYATQPAQLYVDMKTDHKIFKGDSNFDQNITFAYAAVHSSKYFYDDITENSATTPIHVYLYCDLGYATCNNRIRNLLNANTNQSHWWKALDYDNVTKNDGNIALKIGSIRQGSGTPTLSTAAVNINNDGTNDTVTVNKGTGAALPLEVGIDLLTDPTQANYTDRWLIYNPDDNTKAPSPFYKVRFIGNSTWSGVGKTGNVVNTNASSKKTKRLDW